MADNNEAISELQNASAPELAALKHQRTTKSENVDDAILDCLLEILVSYFKQLSYLQSKIEQLCSSDNGRSDYKDLFIATRVTIGILKRRRGSVSIDVTQFNASVAGAVHSSRLH